MKLFLNCLCFLLVIFSGHYSVNGKTEASLQDDDASPKLEFSKDQLTQAVSFAEASLMRLKGQEDAISNSPIHVSNTSASHAQLLDSLPTNQTKELNSLAQIALKASQYILNNECLSNGFNDKLCVEVMSQYKFPQGDLKDKCEAIQRSKRRGLHVYRRILFANYADKLYRMDSQLPAPKNISEEFFRHTRPDNEDLTNETFTAEGEVDPERNIALVQWSQFFEHDLVKTVVQTMSNGESIECCSEDSTNAPPRWRHPACAPLLMEVPEEEYNHLPSCLNYVRSAIGMSPNCSFGAAQQINQVTNRLDLSQIYGNNDGVTNSLRYFHDGLLNFSGDIEYPTLPQVEDRNKEQLCMHNTTMDTVCYKSGDSRVNVNLYVTSLYTLFLRLHNLKARHMKKENPTWDDQTIFEIAQKTNVAIYQKIIYEEWLNVVLGTEDANHINTATSEEQEIGESVSNEFATAGIRFYYSMMPGDLKTTKDVSYFVRQNNIVIRPLTEESILKLKDEYYKPRDLGEDDELEIILDAILKQKAMAMDTGYVADLVKFMYRFKNSQQQSIATDVLALDILRSRDHGINKYTRYLSYCLNSTINDWDGLKDYINEEDLSRLQSIYKDVEDIDLIVGGIAEKPKLGATVGPTLACIIGEQMINTRLSDDEFYTKVNDPNIKSIVENYTGAKLICETTKLTSVPKNIFHVPSEKSPMVDCSDI